MKLKRSLKVLLIKDVQFLNSENKIIHGKDFYYSGHSSVIDPAGETVYQSADIEDIFTARLSLEHLRDVREKLPFLKDRD